MVTLIFMRKWNIITKEKMENFTLGKEDQTESVNDDFDSIFEDLRLKREPSESNWTYFLPKLTEEELKLVTRKDTNYFKTFGKAKLDLNYPDVIEAEMKLSESKSRFVEGDCERETFTLAQPVDRSSDWNSKYCRKCMRRKC